MKSDFRASKFFSKFPTINLGEYVLRDITLSDKEEYYKIFSHPEFGQYLSEDDIPASVEGAVEEIKFWSSLFYRKQSIFWGIAKAEDNKLIGTIGYNNWSIKNGRAEISYDISHELWNKGIMTKIVTNVIAFSYQNMNLDRIEARAMINNGASLRLLEKLGFKQEGIQRHYRIIRGVPEDIALYALLREEFISVFNG